MDAVKGITSGTTNTLDRRAQAMNIELGKDMHNMSHKLVEANSESLERRGRQELVINDILESMLDCAMTNGVQKPERQARETHAAVELLAELFERATTQAVTDPSLLAARPIKSDPRAAVVSPSSDSGSSTESDSDDESSGATQPVLDIEREPESATPLRTKHEMDTDAIHVSRPNITITDSHTLIKLGTISAVLPNAVIVTTFALAERPRPLSDVDIARATALDEGTILCLSDRTLLGAVFETFGPVASPLYIVRFNSSNEIPPGATPGAQILYVQQEMRLVRGGDVRGKGYDASGKDDEEGDVEDFSDDEVERRTKRKRRVKDRDDMPAKRGRPQDSRHDSTWPREDRRDNGGIGRGRFGRGRGRRRDGGWRDERGYGTPVAHLPRMGAPINIPPPPPQQYVGSGYVGYSQQGMQHSAIPFPHAPNSVMSYRGMHSNGLPPVMPPPPRHLPHAGVATHAYTQMPNRLSSMWNDGIGSSTAGYAVQTEPSVYAGPVGPNVPHGTTAGLHHQPYHMNHAMTGDGTSGHRGSRGVYGDTRYAQPPPPGADPPWSGRAEGWGVRGETGPYYPPQQERQ